MDPRNPQNQGFHMEGIQNPWFSRFQQLSSKMHPLERQKLPKWMPNELQERPRKPQEWPKTAPRAPRSAPRAPKERPKRAQEPPKRPRRPQERPKSNFGMNLEPPGPHLEAFSEPLGLNFRTFHAFNATIALAACLLTRLPAAPASMPSKVPWVGGCPR